MKLSIITNIQIDEKHDNQKFIKRILSNTSNCFFLDSVTSKLPTLALVAETK